MPSRLLRVAAWLVVLAAALVLWAHLVPFPPTGRLDAQAPFTQLAAMRPGLAALAVLVGAAVLAVAVRRRRGRAPAVALVVVALASVAQIAPRALSTAEPAGDAPGVTVLVANLLRSEVAPGELVALVRRTRADVALLPETNAAHAERIAAALTAARGERWRAESDGRTPPEDERSASPTSLVVREALGPRRLTVPPDDPRAHGQVRIALSRTVDADGAVVRGAAGPRIAAVHPLPPWPAARQRDWRRDLLALRPLCRRGWIVGGDLNATIDHSPLRSVLRSGCTDAAAATGQGLRETWSGGPFGLVRPAIDHVLTGGDWRPVASGVLRVDGSDHRAVWSRVVRRED